MVRDRSSGHTLNHEVGTQVGHAGIAIGSSDGGNEVGHGGVDFVLCGRNQSLSVGEVWTGTIGDQAQNRPGPIAAVPQVWERGTRIDGARSRASWEHAVAVGASDTVYAVQCHVAADAGGAGIGRGYPPQYALLAFGPKSPSGRAHLYARGLQLGGVHPSRDGACPVSRAMQRRGTPRLLRA